MKYHIITLLALGFAMASCDEPFNGQPGTDTVAPSPVTNAQVTNLEGGAFITYDLPDDEDLLYVKATYTRNRTTTGQSKASVYTDTLKIEGLGDTLSRTVEIVAVDRSGNVSAPLNVTINPKTPPIHKVFKSLATETAFSGLQVKWQNETEMNIAIVVERMEGTERVPADIIYTSRKEGEYGVRGQKAVESTFALYVRDKWMNYSDTMYVTLTPKYEERVPDIKLYYTITDGKAEWQDWGFKPEYLFSDDRNDGGFHTNEDGKWPHNITFKTPKSYKLTRMKLFQRTGDEYFFQSSNPKVYELWGTNSTPVSDGSDDGWTLLGTFTMFKPSGLPYGQLSKEDREAGTLGDEHLLPQDVGLYQYYRLKVTETWQGRKNTHYKKVELYGIPQDMLE